MHISVNRLEKLLSLGPLSIGLIIFFAWALPMTFLQSVFIGLPPMVPWTALNAAFLGLCLFLYAKKFSHVLLISLLTTVCLTTFATLVEYALPIQLGFDRLFYSDHVSYSSAILYPGRMSPQTSSAFLALALAITLRRTPSFKNRFGTRLIFQTLALLALAISLIALVGYIYNVIRLFGLDAFVGVSFLTAVSIFCLSIGTLLLDTEFGTVRAFLQDGAAGVFFRRFMIGGLVAPFVIAAIIQYCEQKRFLRADEGMAMFVLFNITSILGLAVATLKALEKNEGQRLQIKNSEAKLSEANEAGRLKDRFLANVSHEVRTPLTAILGYIDGLKDPGLTPADRDDFIMKAHASAGILLHTLDDVLDFSKLDANHLIINLKAFDLQKLVESSLAQISAVAEKKHLTVSTDWAFTASVDIFADAQRIQQVLLNLLSNAAKFTEAGFIALSISLRADSRLIFEVTDSGLGIDDDKQSRLFQPFYQVDDSITRKYGGNGLGLALSKKIALAMDGDLTLVSSQKNKGSRFRFEVACKVIQKPAVNETPVPVAPPAQIKRLAGFKILLVEDNVDNQFLISRYLRGAGADVEIANNGAEGLKAGLSSSHTVILMDIQMPVMGGLESTRALKQRGCRTPVIALSAHNMMDHRLRSIEAGCEDHLVKPITRDDLINRINEIVTAKAY